MREVASRLTNKAKVVVIPNKGVDRIKFQKVTSRKIGKEIKLLYIGRNDFVKGTKYLIDAFVRIQERYPETTLDIVGISSDEETQFKQIKDYNLSNNIKFNGSVPYEKIVDFYNNSDIFVLPSLMEGLSNAIMEAMASGLPIVATDVGGNKELIKSEKGGYLVQPKNSIELSNAILNLMENPELRKKMGTYNLNIIKQYDSKLIMKKKEKLINLLFNFSKK
jgi:glycosyltransferase involved in cell wall biosynthesis